MQVTIEPRTIEARPGSGFAVVERVRWGIFPQSGKGRRLGAWHDSELGALRWAQQRGHEVISGNLFGYSDAELGERDTDPGTGQLGFSFSVTIRPL